MSGGEPVALLVVGPTAVGKSEVALRLAEDLGGEIVSLDSRQLYRGMDIGTAKPSVAERARVPHHLVDVADPDETWSLADVQERVHAALGDIVSAGRLPLLVGGTGQYVRAVAEGWRVPRVPPDPTFRSEQVHLAEDRGPDALHARLRHVDPVAADAIDPRNVRRVIRALEVCRATGRPFSDQRGREAVPYRFVWMGLTRPRGDLDARIDRRVDEMLAAGLLAEVGTLLAAGYGFDLPSMSGLGYGEWRAMLEGTDDVEGAVERIRRNTRRFARRQAAWFRPDDPRLTWFDLTIVGYDFIRRWVESAVRD